MSSTYRPVPLLPNLPTAPQSTADLLPWSRDFSKSLDALYATLAGRMISEISQGTLAQRPAANGSLRFYFATDTAVLYYDSGSWQAVTGGVGGPFVPTTRLLNTTAPLTGGGDLSADRTLGVSITTTNDGGAIVKQASTPGTQQSGHSNISGTGIFGGEVLPNGNLTGAPSLIASKLDLGTRSMSSTPSAGQVNNRVGISIASSGPLGLDQTNRGSLIVASSSGDSSFTDILSIEHVSTGDGESNAIRIHSTTKFGTGIQIVQDGNGQDCLYVGARGPTTGLDAGACGIGIDVNRATSGSSERNPQAAATGILIFDWSETNNNSASLISNQQHSTTNINVSLRGDGEQLRLSPMNDPATDTKGTSLLRLCTANGVTTKGHLSSAGWFDLPFQPRALVYGSAGQAIADVTPTNLTFDTEEFDLGALHSTASNKERITIPTGGAGTWMFVGQVNFPNGANQRVLHIKRNRSSVVTIRGSAVVQNNAGGVTEFQAIAIDQAQDGDFYYLETYQDSGGSLTVNAGVGVTSFAAIRLF